MPAKMARSAPTTVRAARGDGSCPNCASALQGARETANIQAGSGVIWRIPDKGSRQCLHGDTAQRCWTRRAGRPELSGSSLRTNGVCGLPGGCSSRSAQTAIQRVRISVSSPLLDGYDEPEILRYSSHQICLTSADAGQDTKRKTLPIASRKRKEAVPYARRR